MSRRNSRESVESWWTGSDRRFEGRRTNALLTILLVQQLIVIALLLTR